MRESEGGSRVYGFRLLAKCILKLPFFPLIRIWVVLMLAMYVRASSQTK